MSLLKVKLVKGWRRDSSYFVVFLRALSKTALRIHLLIFLFFKVPVSFTILFSQLCVCVCVCLCTRAWAFVYCSCMLPSNVKDGASCKLLLLLWLLLLRNEGSRWRLLRYYLQGHTVDFPPSKLKQGCGEHCIYVLDRLADEALIATGFRWRKSVMSRTCANKLAVICDTYFYFYWKTQKRYRIWTPCIFSGLMVSNLEWMHQGAYVSIFKCRNWSWVIFSISLHK